MLDPRVKALARRLRFQAPRTRGPTPGNWPHTPAQTGCRRPGCVLPHMDEWTAAPAEAKGCVGLGLGALVAPKPGLTGEGCWHLFVVRSPCTTGSRAPERRRRRCAVLLRGLLCAQPAV